MTDTQTIDTTDLDAAPTAIKYAAERMWSGTVRVYLVTTYPGGAQWHRTGYVSRSTGTRPGYLLMHQLGQVGSSDLLTEETWKNTVVAGIQNSGGHYYTPGNTPQNHPGVTYRDEPSRYGGIDYRVMPGRNRYTEQ